MWFLFKHPAESERSSGLPGRPAELNDPNIVLGFAQNEIDPAIVLGYRKAAKNVGILTRKDGRNLLVARSTMAISFRERTSNRRLSLSHTGLLPEGNSL